MGGDQDRNHVPAPFGEEGSVDIGFIPELFDDFHPLFLALPRYLAAVVEHPVDRSFGKAGASGDVHDRNFVRRGHGGSGQRCKATKKNLISKHFLKKIVPGNGLNGRPLNKFLKIFPVTVHGIPNSFLYL